MRIGIAADHGGFALKERIIAALKGGRQDVVDYGAFQLDQGDDYPDFIIPLAKAVVAGDIERGIAICTSGVGASIVANKIPGVRAALVHDDFSAHQGVEDDNMNIICMGSRVVNYAQAWGLVKTFLAAHFTGAERHQRRLAKIAALEQEVIQP